MKVRDVCKHLYNAQDKGTLAKARRLIDRVAKTLNKRDAPLRIERNETTDTVSLMDREGKRIT